MATSVTTATRATSPVTMTSIVATDRGIHRCNRSTIGDATAHSSSPTMTGTITTERWASSRSTT